MEKETIAPAYAPSGPAQQQGRAMYAQQQGQMYAQQQQQQQQQQQMYGQQPQQAYPMYAGPSSVYGGPMAVAVPAGPTVVYVSGPGYRADVPTPLQYDALERRYRQLDSAIVGLSITQMVLWFPLGFLYFIGLMPLRGRLHMGMGILFFLLSLIGFIVLVAINYYSCEYSYYEWACYYVPALKTVAFVFVPYLALSAASIGVGANHRSIENLLRLADDNRFVNTYRNRISSTPNMP